MPELSYLIVYLIFLLLAVYAFFKVLHLIIKHGVKAGMIAAQTELEARGPQPVPLSQSKWAK